MLRNGTLRGAMLRGEYRAAIAPHHLLADEWLCFCAGSRVVKTWSATQGRVAPSFA